jgi:GNAT superfamily N-acetyltransferase
METPSPPITVRPAAADEVIDLRHAVLRAGLPRESAVFEGDERTTTRHFVAADSRGRVVGCATMLRSEWDGHPAWQVRGMAVAPELRGTGVGRLLLDAIERHARRDGPLLLWCNARAPATPFYQRLGWSVTSDRFDIPTAGPHFRMTRRLRTPPTAPSGLFT